MSAQNDQKKQVSVGGGGLFDDSSSPQVFEDASLATYTIFFYKKHFQPSKVSMFLKILPNSRSKCFLNVSYEKSCNVFCPFYHCSLHNLAFF